MARLLELGQWPHACSEELRAHVARCRACGARVTLTEGLRAMRRAAMAEAQVPSAGALWWRAQLRRRNAAMVRVSRPMLGAQVFALAVAAVFAAGALAWALHAGWRVDAAAWLKDAAQGLHWGALVPDAMPRGMWWWLAPLAGMLALASGVAVCVASENVDGRRAGGGPEQRGE